MDELFDWSDAAAANAAKRRQQVAGRRKFMIAAGVLSAVLGGVPGAIYLVFQISLKIVEQADEAHERQLKEEAARNKTMQDAHKAAREGRAGKALMQFFDIDPKTTKPATAPEPRDRD